MIVALDPNPVEKFSAPLIANRTSFYSTSSVEDAERDVEQYPASDREPTVVYDKDTNTECLHKETLSFSMQLLKKKLLNLGNVFGAFYTKHHFVRGNLSPFFLTLTFINGGSPEVRIQK